MHVAKTLAYEYEHFLAFWLFLCEAYLQHGGVVLCLVQYYATAPDVSGVYHVRQDRRMSIRCRLRETLAENAIS